MTQTGAPQVQPYKHHLFVCTGTKCAPEKSQALYQWTKQRLKDLNLHEGSERVQRSQSQCLGVCSGGPLAVVYPQGVWYHSLDEARMEKVIQKHLIQGEIVQEYLLYPKP